MKSYRSLTYIPNMVEPLKSLFESRGFVFTRANKFEDYNLYIENRDFLSKDNFITFMNGNKLMALKHDVTLSIIKNIPNGELENAQKLYYMDEVYRLSQKTNEYKVINQLGVELIGSNDPFSNIEIIDLSLHTMAAIGVDFLLDISHIGFISGLLENLNLSKASIHQTLSALHNKSLHLIDEILIKEKIYRPTIDNILKIANMRLPLPQALPELSAFCTNNKTKEAFDELETIAKALKNSPYSDNLFLDFSTISNMTYYDNIVFSGYCAGISKSILIGGRYDNLLKKMNKKNGAIGFAVDLSELDLYQPNESLYDFDAVLTYPKHVDFSQLMAARDALLTRHSTVRLEHQASPLPFKYKTLYFFDQELTQIENKVAVR